jgi:tetratricopeptide (TPR) repeat protein
MPQRAKHLCLARGEWSRSLLLLTVLGLSMSTGCRREARVDPAQQVETGWSWYRSGDFGLAIKAFEAALANAGRDGLVRQQALYGLASTWNLRRPDEDLERAKQYYDEAIAANPTSDLAAWSLLAVARMQAAPVAGEATDVKVQVKAYQDVIARFPFHPAGEEAFLFQQAARLSETGANETADVLAALDAFLDTHPQTPWRSTAYRLIAHCCELLGLKERWVDAAKKEWDFRAIDPRKAAQDLSWKYWRIATLAEFETGDFALAREYYGKLLTEYPTEQRAFLAKQELKRMDELEARVRGQGSGARSQESGARSQEPGVRSQEPGARSQESGVRSQR